MRSGTAPGAGEPAGGAAEQSDPVRDSGSRPSIDVEDSVGAAAEQFEAVTNPDRASRHQPRTGTKRALILDLLHRAEGASIDDLSTRTTMPPSSNREFPTPHGKAQRF